MALYKEVSSDILTRIAKQQEEDKLRKLQEQAQSQQTKMDNKYNGGLGGFLGGIVGGIGQGISNIGNSVIDMLGSGVASAKDLGSILTTGKSAGENKKWLMYRRGTDNAKDAYAKTAGQALNAATDLATTVLPGVGAGSKVAKALGGTVANTAAGAIGGVADEFQQQGADANLESAANRAISGAAAGLATGGLNKKIGNATSKAGSALLNNKLATSTIGRGALSGAVGGATGAGTSAALGGGDVAQAAIQGGLTGAVAGGTQAGLMSGVNRLAQGAKNRLGINGRTDIATQTDATPAENAQNTYSVILENGKPKKFYHGSPSTNIDEFDLSLAGKNTSTGEKAVYFTDDMATADDFSYERLPSSSMFVDNKGKKGQVYERYLKMDNPLNLSTMTDKQIDGLWEYASNSGKMDGKAKFVERMKEARDYGNDQLAKSYLDVGALKDSGYDGLIAKMYPGQNEVREYAVFDTKNILKEPGVTTPTTEATVKKTADGLDIPDYTKPKDWSGKELVLEKKGALGALGDKIKNVSRGIKDQDVYNSLYSKTADKVINNNSIERLRELGFEPKDYKNAADVSTAVNKFFDDVIKNSGATITDNDLTTRLYNPDVTFQTDNLRQRYETKINNLITNLEKGAFPGNYNAIDLHKAAREFSDYAATEYRKGIDVNGSDIGNGRSDLGDAYMRVSRDLRNLADKAMDGLGDNYTRSQLTQMLENMNAPKKTVEYFGDFKDLADGIRKTSLLEDARQMNKEMSKTKVRRNATAGNSKSLLNRIADKTGVGQIIDAVAEPVGKVTGTAAEIVGTGLQKLDNGVQNIQSTPVAPMNTDTQNILGNYIGRTQGELESGNMVQNARKAADNETLQSLLADIQTTQNNVAQLEEMARPKTVDPMQQQLENIYAAMNNALAAGDIESYNELSKMYTTAYGIYQNQAKINGLGATDSESKLSTAEKNQIAKLQSAGTALDQLESLYQKAGGGQGIIGGNIANFLGGLGLNSDVNTYNQLAQGLINQIGAAIGKTDSLNTEGEVQRALSLVPKITDDNQTAMNKIATLRSLLQQNTGTYNQLYGA